jgi:hypothetical protein
MSREASTQDANISGAKIDPLEAPNKVMDTHASLTATGDSDTLAKTHLEPLADEHTKNLPSGIGGHEDELAAGDTFQNMANKASQVATQAKEAIVDAATSMYNAAAGKK